MQRIVWKALLIALVVLSVAGGPNAQAHASSTTGSDIWVDMFTDVVAEDGSCSLREAILSANTNASVDCTPGSASDTDYVRLPAGFFQLSLAGEDGTDPAALGDLDILGDLVVVGAGRGLTTIDGGDKDRVFHTRAGVAVTIENLTIQNGNRPFIGGGCIWNTGTITLQEVVVRGCDTGGSGGGLLNWPTPPETVMAVANLALSSLPMPERSKGLDSYSLRDLLTRNLLTSLDVPQDVVPKATFVNSSLTDNVAGDGGGIFNSSLSEIYVYNSTLNANRASTTYGGGLDNAGIGLLQNVTVSGNEALLDGGGIFNDGTLDIESSTIVNNSSLAQNSGGNIRALSLTRFMNTLVANNSSGTNCSGDAGYLVSLGYNIDSEHLAVENHCDFTESTDIQMVGYFALGPLINNGGSTLTHALPLESPAIDAGDDDNCPTRDQRGAVRPADGTGDEIAHCDIGAYEYNGLFPKMLLLPIIQR